ncbi:MAG: hormogonium polysaccharide secretion pseudopilin HpsC [Microcoleus anatoxicus]|uniref:hormogonium polysaccharide secretion pseudopilin HpsC n=1 Tax=Microcoleus anatoxicus TaxID=2705319 RepID=UPI00366A57D1
MKTLLRLLLKNQHQQNRSKLDQTEKGMTLVELLVGSIMAFLIITPMLAFVVDMLNTDRKEQLKSNTEQDLQAAVDFISQDLSQAIYIYDNAAINTIRSQLPENGNQNKIPILVFWKRQRIKNAIPINPTVYKTVKPKDCATDNNKKDQCNDTDVLSLVAYYQFKDKDDTWCQPSGGTCPTRIARYEIKDGVKNPDATDFTNPYYSDSDTILSQQRDPAFNQKFDFNKPTLNVTDVTKLTNLQSQVLVNYIDHSSNTQTQLPPTECETALGNPKDQKTEQFLKETTLRATDTEGRNSFYACVDTAKNIARVTIRGNSLRRLQANDADFKTTSSAFFPTATVQVKGLGARGK